jgi:hypothetical protein
MGEAIVAHEQDTRKYLKENKELKRRLRYHLPAWLVDAVYRAL